ncbi:MAG: MBL fold metallo-hydrolase [Gammaproteobacteria bacterium]
MILQELNGKKCKTYLVACEVTNKALLIDPLQDNIDRYLALLAYKKMELDAALDTHTHADHLTGTTTLAYLTGCRVIMERHAPSPAVTQHVAGGDFIEIGKVKLKIIYTPGHTPDSISLHMEGYVFTGDVLLINGTGRTDFAGGDAGDQYDSITTKLYALPEHTIVLPGHDYRGNSRSTIGDEKRNNPRIAKRSREEYISLMENLKFPLPDKIQEVLQLNQTAIDDEIAKFPELAQLSAINQLSCEQLKSANENNNGLFLLDVRELREFRGELGHVAGSILIPLKDLVSRAEELEIHKDKHIVCICRAGVRSTTAAAILTGLGFDDVSNLKGGMLDWNGKGFPTQR